MYLNDVHILYYIAIAILGVFAGQFSDWMTKRAIAEKKIFSKDILVEYKNNFKPSWVSIGITVFIYLIMLYIRGINGNLYRKFNINYIFNYYTSFNFNV